MSRAKGPVGPLVHGTPGGYRNHGCRCDQCRTAMRPVWVSAARGQGVKPQTNAGANIPIGPLADFLTVRLGPMRERVDGETTGATPEGLARQVGTDPATWNRAVRAGVITESRADRWAINVGRDAPNIWPDWYSLTARPSDYVLEPDSALDDVFEVSA